MPLKPEQQEREQLIQQLESELEYYYQLSRSQLKPGKGEQGRLTALESKLETTLEEVAALTGGLRLATARDKETKAQITAQLASREKLESELAAGVKKWIKTTAALKQSTRLAAGQKAKITAQEKARKGLESKLDETEARLQNLEQVVATGINENKKLKTKIGVSVAREEQLETALERCTHEHAMQKETSAAYAAHLAASPLLRVVRLVREAKQLGE